MTDVIVPAIPVVGRAGRTVRVVRAKAHHPTVQQLPTEALGEAVAMGFCFVLRYQPVGSVMWRRIALV